MEAAQRRSSVPPCRLRATGREGAGAGLGLRLRNRRPRRRAAPQVRRHGARLRPRRLRGAAAQGQTLWRASGRWATQRPLGDQRGVASVARLRCRGDKAGSARGLPLCEERGAAPLVSQHPPRQLRVAVAVAEHKQHHLQRLVEKDGPQRLRSSSVLGLRQRARPPRCLRHCRRFPRAGDGGSCTPGRFY